MPESPDASAEESREALSPNDSTEDNPKASDAEGSRRARPGTRVLLPGSQAWKRAPQPEPTTPARPENAGQSTAISATRVQRASQQAREGTIFWMGKLKKNEVVVIEGSEASWGYTEGQFLPRGSCAGESLLTSDLDL